MINTIDLDKCSKDQLRRIISKIIMKECCLELDYADSNSKGYHIRLRCSIENCDICRLVFDDPKRFDIDSVMPLKYRDFLFQEKIYLGNLPITKENLEKIREMKI
jgi:hypothetical protein